MKDYEPEEKWYLDSNEKQISQAENTKTKREQKNQGQWGDEASMIWSDCEMKNYKGKSITK